MNRHPIARSLATRLEGTTTVPATQLIVEDIWLSVVEGTLESGERLPTVRELAVGLNVSPRTVQRAYDELERRGVTESRAGEGTFVSLSPPSAEERERHRELAELCRATVERARELGFELNELLDALAEYRTLEREVTPRQEGT